MQIRWTYSLLVLTLFLLSACVDSDQPQKQVNLFEPTEFGTYNFEGEPNINAVDRLDFGDVPLGTTASRRIEVRNTGRDKLKFSDITISPDFELRYENNQSPTELAPGESTYLTIYYLSREELGARGTLDIGSNDPDSPVWTIVLAANIKFPCVTLDRDAVDFGLIDPGQVRSQSVFLENCSENAAAEINLERFEGQPEFAINGFPDRIRLEPGERHEVIITFSPLRPGSFQGGISLTTNDAERPELFVAINGLGRSPDCPVAVLEASHPERQTGVANPYGEFNGLPLDRIRLDASRSFDPEGGELEFLWTLVSKPTDSNAVLESGMQGVIDNELWLDLAGDYVVELNIITDAGLPACEAARLTLHAVSDEDIHLQLVWDTPNDPQQEDASGSDVDLHFMRPTADSQWNSSPWDCFWMNMEPNWGGPGGLDNPSLDRDDVDGLGPENINLDNPENNVTYKLGVHYFSDHGYGAAFATVRIYVGGVLFKEIVRQRLGDQDFWYVADIAWPGGVITDVNQTFPTIP